MTTALPPSLILLDLSALLVENTRSWQEFTRVGECFVPLAVLEEIESLSQQAAEPEIEQVAREFMRFFPTSGWKRTLLSASHITLQPAEGHKLSKKARLSLAVAQAALGLAQNRSDAIVIVVANDQGLIQRLRPLKMPNLCGIPLAVMVQWCRTQRKPPAVLNQLQAMRSTVSTTAPVTSGLKSQPVRPTTPIRPVATEPKRSPVQKSARRGIRPLQIFYNLLTLFIIAIIGMAAWRVLQPVSFAKFWRQLPLTDRLPTQKLPPPKK